MTALCPGSCSLGWCVDAACPLSQAGCLVSQTGCSQFSKETPRVPINFLGIPWPSLFSSRLTTVSRFLCLIMLFTVVYRVGGLNRHPLIYEVVGVGKTKIKQREERGSAGSVRPALWGLRCEVGGDFLGGAWRFRGQQGQLWEAQGAEATQTYSHPSLVWDFRQVI